MKDIKAFLRVPVETQDPENSGYYHVYYGEYKAKAYFDKTLDILFRWRHDKTIMTPDEWLKEISLSEYMVGFTQWLCKNFELHPKEEPFWYDVNLIVDKINYKYYTTDCLLELYFIEQGIIIK